MTVYRNVLRDLTQNGYPVDFQRMLAGAPDLAPMAEAMREKFPEQCQQTLEVFYESGLYFHLDDNNPSAESKAAVHHTLAMWAASMVRFVSSVTVVSCDWIHSQGEEFDLETYSKNVVPPNCGILCLTKPPRWNPDNKIALFADKLLWGRRNNPAYATIVVGSLTKYPHQASVLTIEANADLDNLNLDNYDPTTGFSRGFAAKKAPKRR